METYTKWDVNYRYRQFERLEKLEEKRPLSRGEKEQKKLAETIVRKGHIFWRF